jgi:hypothetical protein
VKGREEVRRRLRRVREFVESGGSICPLAARCPIRYGLDPDGVRSVLTVLSPGEAAVVLSARQIARFEAVEEWARKCFLRVADAAIGLSAPEMTDEVRRRAVRDVGRLLEDPRAQIRPVIGLRGEPVVTTCMAPVYPRNHPRWAPEPMLVLVRVSDMARVGMLPGVRRAIERAHGFLYDADELVVKLPAQTASEPTIAVDRVDDGSIRGAS